MSLISLDFQHFLRDQTHWKIKSKVETEKDKKEELALGIGRNCANLIHTGLEGSKMEAILIGSSRSTWFACIFPGNQTDRDSDRRLIKRQASKNLLRKCVDQDRASFEHLF